MKTAKQYRQIIVALTLPLLVTSCSNLPKQLDHQEQDQDRHFKRLVQQDETIDALYMHQATALSDDVSPEFILSQGDLLRLTILGMENYDGLYQINNQGLIELPFIEPLKARGKSATTLQKEIASLLVSKQWFYDSTVHVSVIPVRLAPINISVSGAVFNPGKTSINNQPIQKQEDGIQQQGGAFSTGRSLTTALMAAGGIRPDAKLNEIYIQRGQQISQYDLSHIIGSSIIDTQNTPSLIDGDKIYVTSNGTENADFITPSPITPPGIRVLMSNLTAPALSNAQSAIGNDSSRLPYGSSLLDSAVSANCVGGTHQANASRSVILITRNYGSKPQIVIERSINELLANASISTINPYVMPNDAIACYDSRFTNFRDVARGLGELISPILLGRLL